MYETPPELARQILELEWELGLITQEEFAERLRALTPLHPPDPLGRFSQQELTERAYTRAIEYLIPKTPMPLTHEGLAQFRRELANGDYVYIDYEEEGHG